MLLEMRSSVKESTTIVRGELDVALESPPRTVRTVQVPIAWEYEIDRSVGSLSEERLNLRGLDGWELVEIYEGVEGVESIFKRPRY